MTAIKMEDVLVGIERCPHCGVAKPQMAHLWESFVRPRGAPEHIGIRWATYACSSCLYVILVESLPGHDSQVANLQVGRFYPSLESVDAALPQRAARYLAQALESKHAPDGAVMLAGSAVDAMLKARGFNEGSLYSRIDKAVQDNQLTKEMGEWAHSVRLESNRPRHADADEPHTDEEQARHAIEFAMTLGHVLFVLPERVRSGRAAAKAETKQEQ